MFYSPTHRRRPGRDRERVVMRDGEVHVNPQSSSLFLSFIARIGIILCSYEPLEFVKLARLKGRCCIAIITRDPGSRPAPPLGRGAQAAWDSGPHAQRHEARDRLEGVGGSPVPARVARAPRVVSCCRYLGLFFMSYTA